MSYVSLAGELKVIITDMLVCWILEWTGASRQGIGGRECRGILAKVKWQAMGVGKEVDALRWQ